MAQLTIRINGYAYTVGCDDGQEPHLLAMAELVEQRINSIKALGGQSGEARLLVLASLLMADELHDTNRELAKLRNQPQPAGRTAPSVEAPAWLQERLTRLAENAEAIADGLDSA